VLEVAGATVGTALADAFSRYPALRIRLVDEAGVIHPHLAVFCNDTQVRREEATHAPLGPGDTLTLLVAVDGG